MYPSGKKRILFGEDEGFGLHENSGNGMKLLCTEYNPDSRMAIVPLGDNALLRNNDDFYIPEYVAEISCVPQWVIRISKLGKSVGERFAERYFEEIGVGIRFYAGNFEKELQGAGLPSVMASSFDGSAAISSLLPKERVGEAVYTFRVNGKVMDEGKWQNLPVTPARLISFASAYYTLKIGDFLYCGNCFRYDGLKLGDRLQIEFQGKAWMDFKLK